MNNLVCPQIAMNGNSGSMIQIQRDKICKAPVYTSTLFNRNNNIKK